MSKLHNRAQSNKDADFLLKIGLVSGQSIEHLGSTLRVTNISNLFLSCYLSDVLQISRDIMLAHLLEREFPVVFVRNLSVVGM